MYTVYKITNTQTKMAYIGVTSRTPQERFWQHTLEARRGKIRGTNMPIFLTTLAECGPELFVVESLATANTREEAVLLEAETIKVHETMYPKGYNSQLRRAEAVLETALEEDGASSGLAKVQIYLDQEMIDWLQERAAVEHLKVSQVARRLIAKEMEADQQTEEVTHEQPATNVQ